MLIWGVFTHNFVLFFFETKRALMVIFTLFACLRPNPLVCLVLEHLQSFGIHQVYWYPIHLHPPWLTNDAKILSENLPLHAKRLATLIFTMQKSCTFVNTLDIHFHLDTELLHLVVEHLITSSLKSDQRGRVFNPISLFQGLALSEHWAWLEWLVDPAGVGG